MLRNRVVWGIILLSFFSSVCYASGDFGCGLPRGSIFFRSHDHCNSVPFLSPSNDSRLNLELLLIDAGKLTGTLELSTDHTLTPELTQLLVPFDLDNWQLREPGSGRAAETADAESAANASDTAQGGGSRCNSAGEGEEAFSTAVNAANGLTKEEAAALIAARGALKPNCDAKTNAEWKAPEAIRSRQGREFADYIAGANAFYGGDFAAALESFNALKNSPNSWLKETSRYMVGRTLLNSAQRKAFGEWGEFLQAKVDKENVKGAEDAFDAYLENFPHGLYTVSARGLLRRVYWLDDDKARLAEAFDRALSAAGKDENNVTVLELVQEAEAKLLDSLTADQIQSPQFLTILDLMSMRTLEPATPGAPVAAGLTLADLEAQKDKFAARPELYQYLLATYHVYVENKPDLALALLPALSGSPLNYFAFSQQTLRVLAMDASKQYDQERKLLLQMLPLASLPQEPEQVQLALAMLEVRTAHADRIFAADSAVREKAIRALVVEYIASAEMLRQRIKDPKESADIVDAALYSLLYKELIHGKYQAFQADLALVPAHPSEALAPFVAGGGDSSEGYHCPAMRAVASKLQREGNDAQSLNCVGELVRVHDVRYGQGLLPPTSDLGGSDSLFPGMEFSRMDGYLKVIADKQADGEARAYALYRAVECYAPAGYNECGKQDIPKGTRKAWFQMLHKEYPTSNWTALLKYYW